MLHAGVNGLISSRSHSSWACAARPAAAAAACAAATEGSGRSMPTAGVAGHAHESCEFDDEENTRVNSPGVSHARCVYSASLFNSAAACPLKVELTRGVAKAASEGLMPGTLPKAEAWALVGSLRSSPLLFAEDVAFGG